MRVHITPAFGAGAPHPQCTWLREVYARSTRERYTLVDRPEDADAVLLTDVGVSVGHVRFRAELLRLLVHPLVVKYRSRCFIYHEDDVPRPYLPGLYLNMEWFPGIDRMAAAIAPTRHLDTSPNPFLQDIPPPEERDLLFSFMGRNCHPVRDGLLNMRYDRDDIALVDTSERYDHYDDDRDRPMQREYVDVMRRSRWAVCPRGWSTGSLRLFEAMRLGIAPVVLSDGWQRPSGPVWEACCLWLPENEYPDLVEILESEGEAWYSMGIAAQQAYQDFFASDRAFEHTMDALEALLPRWRAESMLLAALRQIHEVAIHVIGFTSPRLTRARRHGNTSIAAVSPRG